MRPSRNIRDTPPGNRQPRHTVVPSVTVCPKPLLTQNLYTDQESRRQMKSSNTGAQ